jgi:hypothetical protein
MGQLASPHEHEQKHNNNARSTMTAPQHAMLLVSMALLLPTTLSFHSTTLSVVKDSQPFLRMARVKQMAPIEFRTRRRYNTWTQMIRQLEAFYKQHGHSRVSRQQDSVLNQWVVLVRNNYRQGEGLSEGQLQQLEQVEFCWNAHEATWKMRYEQLCEFQNQHGHSRVTDGKLAVWVRNQQREYRYYCEGKKTTLSPERLEALQAINFLKDLPTYEKVWQLRFEELKDFHDKNNHSNVPEDYTANYSLGQWVMNQRTQYKRFLAGLSTSLTPTRIASLETLDFRWNVHTYHWFGMLELLRKHETQNDHLENLEPNLHIWLVKQRHLYQRKLQGRSSPLTEKRIQALEQVPGFSWSGRSAAYRGPSTNDWAKLFEGMREKGISPGMRPKQHWFEGVNRFQDEIKETWTEEDLLELWNQDDEEEGNEIEI